ncbi:MAG: peptidoglycan hydrolase-like protein with peptidoglycan-binding domain, partial [Candidatus Azotimanducaceae bacterium]
MSPHNTTVGLSIFSTFLFVSLFLHGEVVVGKFLDAQVLSAVSTSDVSTKSNLESGAQGTQVLAQAAPATVPSAPKVLAQATIDTLFDTVSVLPVQTSVQICTFTRGLDIGKRGDDVLCLQRFLQATGYYIYFDGPTGYFGQTTAEAVGAWQRSVGLGLSADYGLFGPQSRAAYARTAQTTPLNNSGSSSGGGGGSAVQETQTTPTGSSAGIVSTGTQSGGGSGSTNVSTSASSICTVSQALNLGSRGTNVTCLQNLLIEEGFYTYPGGATGYYGPVTKAAVARWQAANNISNTGFVGTASRVTILTKTLAKLTKARSGGGGGSAVVNTQTTPITPSVATQNTATQGGTGITGSGALSDTGSVCTVKKSLNIGSRGEDVECTQKFLIEEGFYTYPGGATGYYGPVTKAAVARWQQANNISNTGSIGIASRVQIAVRTVEKLSKRAVAATGGSFSGAQTNTVVGDTSTAGGTVSTDTQVADSETTTKKRRGGGGSSSVVTQVMSTESIISISDAKGTEGGKVIFTLTRTGNTKGTDKVDVVVSIATGDTANGVDFKNKTETVTFNNGETTATFAVDVRDDLDTETDETFTVTLANPRGEKIRIEKPVAVGTVIDRIPTGNISPIADAGVDVSAIDNNKNGVENINLDASASDDVDGSVKSHVWTDEDKKEIATGENPRNVEFALGEHVLTLTVTDDEGASDTDTVSIVVAKRVNTAPSANAGKAQTITDTDRDYTEVVSLDGSASRDSDGSIASYAWAEGSAILSTEQSPTLTLNHGAHVLVLTVTDDEGATNTDTVVITVVDGPNTDPSADAGLDQTVIDTDRNGSHAVVLSGSGADTDGTIASYVWTENKGVFSTVQNPNLIFAQGVHTLTLTVTDNDGGTDTDTVVLTVVDGPNAAPVAEAGSAQTVTDTDRDDSQAVTLRGSGSDTDGKIVSYSWTESRKVLSTTQNPTLTLDQGVHTLTLTITDNEGATDNDTVVVTVVDGPNTAPIADAGSDESVIDTNRNGNENVNLTAAASTDTDGSIASYVWTEKGIEIATGVSPRNVNFSVGVHTVLVTVTDNEGATGSDIVSVTVTPLENITPSANAGSAQTVTDTNRNGSESVTLSGSGSDSDGSIASYEWKEGSTVLSTSQNPTLTLDVGSHTLTLTVTDNDGGTGSDGIVITVNAPANVSPTVEAGSAQTVTDTNRNGSESVTLSGSGTDTDGTIVTYSWA